VGLHQCGHELPYRVSSGKRGKDRGRVGVEHVGGGGQGGGGGVRSTWGRGKGGARGEGGRGVEHVGGEG
jgi:hypothetical protein